MDYLGKISSVPERVEKEINSSRKFYEPIVFYFDETDDFNSFHSKANRLMTDTHDKSNGRCIVEDDSKSKYIIDIEQINYFYDSLSADVHICGLKKLK